MATGTQQSEYLHLSQEYWSIKEEVAETSAALRRLGTTFAANAKILKEFPQDWTTNAVWLSEEIQHGETKAERLRELLSMKEANQAALDLYKGVFPPVPGSE